MQPIWSAGSCPLRSESDRPVALPRKDASCHEQTHAVQHDRTFIGRIERGFRLSRLPFSQTGLRVGKKTIANFIEKASRPMYLKDRLGDVKTDCRNRLHG
jgi:hypothetical protein